MCGRYVLSTTTEDLLEEFDTELAVGDELPPSWNIAPTQQIRMVALRRPRPDSRPATDPAAVGDGTAADTDPVRQLRTVRWGLVPHWAKDRGIGARMINARSETIAEKPSFKAAAARRRCLIPANGYYEWAGTPGRKTPYYLSDPDRPVLAFAGLYEIWRDRERPDTDPDAWLWTASIITRPAPDSLGHIHDRSPVAVPADARNDWLDCADSSAVEAAALLAAMAPPALVPREVGRAAGNVRNNSPRLIDPVHA